jgi:hypothetical protein
MQDLIISNIEDITLDTKLLEFTAPNGKVVIDIKRLLQSEGEDAYINVTHISKIFNKDAREFFKLKSTREYIEALEEYLNISDSKKSKIKLKYTKRGRETEETKKKGIYGTFIHKELSIVFLRWLDIRFAIACDQFIKKAIIQCEVLKMERSNTKALFHPLTDSIKDIYIPAQTSANGKKFAYSSLMTLINMQVLGCSAKKYANDNDIEVDTKGGKSVRDYLPKNMLEEIKLLEEDLNGYIKYARITNYNELRNRIEEE